VTEQQPDLKITTVYDDYDEALLRRPIAQVLEAGLDYYTDSIMLAEQSGEKTITCLADRLDPDEVGDFEVPVPKREPGELDEEYRMRGGGQIFVRFVRHRQEPRTRPFPS
jgi:hypothetical protein